MQVTWLPPVTGGPAAAIPRVPGVGSSMRAAAAYDGDPLAQPGQPVPRRRCAAAYAVVGDLDRGRGQADGARAGAGMPDDVGEPLAHDPAEQLLVGRIDVIHRPGQVGGDARRPQQLPPGGEFPWRASPPR